MTFDEFAEYCNANNVSFRLTRSMGNWSLECGKSEITRNSGGNLAEVLAVAYVELCVQNEGHHQPVERASAAQKGANDER